MFVELNSILDIDKDDKLSGHVIGMSESSSDGNFLLHHFLSMFLKREIPVCFVSLSHSLNHYNTVSLKFGLKLVSLKATHQLTFVEGLKLLGEALYNNTVSAQPGGDKGEDNPFSFSDTNSLSNLKSHIERIYHDTKKLTTRSPTIIIDNLSLLLSIGIPMKEIMGLVHYLNELIQGNDGKENGCLVLFCDNGKNSHDEENELLWKFVAHLSTLQIVVSGLASGYCKDVHGEISIQWKHSLLPVKQPKKMQFKLSDKNVTFFAAGMSSAIL